MERVRFEGSGVGQGQDVGGRGRMTGQGQCVGVARVTAGPSPEMATPEEKQLWEVAEFSGDCALRGLGWGPEGRLRVFRRGIPPGPGDSRSSWKGKLEALGGGQHLGGP